MPGSTLTRIEPPRGSLVIMAASRGQQALDRLSETDAVPNGLFTRELVRHMRIRGLSAVEMLRQVRSSVEAAAEAVNHKQRPALMDESSSDFFFYPAVATAPTATGQAVTAPAPVATPPRLTSGAGAPNLPPVQATVPVPNPNSTTGAAAITPQREYELWDQAMRADTREAFEGFLQAVPDGRYSERARARLAQFGKPPAAPPAIPPTTPAPAPNDREAEFSLWDRARSSNRAVDYEAYLQKYPAGRYADRARAALAGAR
jgi:hypothetical protein